MEFLTKALEALPSIATSPLAFLGYVFTVGAWVYAVSRSRRLKVLLQSITNIPETDRAKIIQMEFGDVVPSNISAEEWILAKKHRYFLVAFLASLITISAISAIAIYEGLELAKVAAQVRLQQQEKAQRQYALEKKRGEFEARQQAIDEQINAADMEYRRGASGLMFAPMDQKDVAIQIMNTAAEERKKLMEEKKKLQDLIDAMPIE